MAFEEATATVAAATTGEDMDTAIAVLEAAAARMNPG
jgi:hypothetical protein